MPQVVQANCPHCQKTLRIPAEWLGRSMRCKNCQQVFQPRSQPSGPSATAVTAAAAGHIPIAVPAVARPAAHDPFGFDDLDHSLAAPASRPRRRNRNKTLVMLAIFSGLILVGLSTAAVLYRKLSSSNSPSDGRAETTTGSAENTVATAKTNSPSSAKAPSTTKSSSPRTTPAATSSSGKFPRRALLISVNNYLMFNRVHYGEPADRSGSFFRGSSTGALRDRFQMAPMNMDKDQVIELSDEGKPLHPTQKAVIETTIQDFLAGCREQDRIILFFAGHACDIEKDSYLIPIEGTREEPDKLIKLQWVYDQLAKCKARQKVFILDVFRYSPARGFELPGAGEGERGEMGEVFDQNLQKAPPGVQVWSACIKGQASIETDSGSAFIQCLLNALADRTINSGIGVGGDPLPIDKLVVDTNQQLKKKLTPEKQEQVSRLIGQETAGGAPYNPEEPMPALLALKPPPAPPGGLASNAQIDKVLEEIRLLPPVRETRAGEQKLLHAANLPPFPAKAMEEFKTDKSIAEMRGQFEKSPETFSKQYPLRGAYFETIAALEDSNKMNIRETLNGPSPIDPKRKAGFLKEQEPAAELIFKLQGTLAQLEEAEKDREKETSKRWQANFDYARTRLESRLAYLLEYNYLIAGIRADRLPDLEPGQTGWRVGSSKKLKNTEQVVKKLVKSIQKHWKEIEDGYPETPWAMLARRENLVALGLEWRAKSD
jgi:hypothetical protein